jgi:nitroimidazol reductase NimA-like FMN-containing flavoprotein (pyridoxamine 5'-phosphate oxidase superfamily)
MTGKIDQRTGLEVLDRDECLALLGRSTLGRIAVVVDDRPHVFPVNFALDGDSIVLRTDDGTKLHAARKGWVAFECDGIDAVYHTGWSVLASGIAEEVNNEAELADLAKIPLALWSPGPTTTWLRIRPRSVTGRRIPPHGHSRTEEV